MPNHKSEAYKLSAIDYYLTEDITQEDVCKIFKCSARSLMRRVDKYKNTEKLNDTIECQALIRLIKMK